MRNGSVYQRKPLALRIDASESSCWPTPQLATATQGQNEADGKRGQTLVGAARGQMWPTPGAAVSNDGEEPETWLARQETLKAKGYNGNGAGMPLAIAATLWGTPRVTTNGGIGYETDSADSRLEDQAASWPTPMVEDSEQAGSANANMTSLSRKVQTWAPTSEANWPSPRVTRGSYTRDQGDPTKERPTLAGLASSHRAQATQKDGRAPSKQTRLLNPRFVEWLMSWPIGWSALEQSEPVSFPSWQQRHSAYLRIVLASISEK